MFIANHHVIILRINIKHDWFCSKVAISHGSRKKKATIWFGWFVWYYNPNDYYNLQKDACPMAGRCMLIICFTQISFASFIKWRYLEIKHGFMSDKELSKVWSHIHICINNEGIKLIVVSPKQVKRLFSVSPHKKKRPLLHTIWLLYDILLATAIVTSELSNYKLIFSERSHSWYKHSM